MANAVETSRRDAPARAPTFLVVGGLNTDLIGVDVPSMLSAGGQAVGGRLVVRPGGKARNVAQLLTRYLPDGDGAASVAMIGRTCRDAAGLWRVPLDALRDAGVDLSAVTVEDAATDAWPGVALIPVTGDGQHQIYVLPGANARFAPEDVDRADGLLRAAAQRQGWLIVSLEVPWPTAAHAMARAWTCGLRVAVDPGGLATAPDRPDAFAGVDVLKPNAEEASLLTGVDVHDARSAAEAADRLRARGVRAVLVTLGAQGGWWADASGAGPLSAPAVRRVVDPTGCGDQVLAVLCAELRRGRPFPGAAHLAMAAGALQATRLGVSPLTADEIAAVAAAGAIDAIDKDRGEPDA